MFRVHESPDARVLAWTAFFHSCLLPLMEKRSRHILQESALSGAYI